jgi:hypothetical protein
MKAMINFCNSQPCNIEKFQFMKNSLLLGSFFFCVLIGQSQVIQRPSGQPGKVELKTPKILPLPAPPAKVAFEAIINRRLSGATSGVQFQSVSYNDGNGFSLASNEFVVPDNGLYFLSVNLNWNGFGCTWGAGAEATVMIMKNDREVVQSFSSMAPSGGEGGTFNTALSFSKKFLAGDRLSVHIVATQCDNGGGGGTAAVIRTGSFSGYRIFSE